MTKKRIFVTRRWPEAVEAKLSELFDPVFNTQDKPLGEAEIGKAMLEFDAVLTTVTDKLTAETFNSPGMKTQILGNYGVGYSHIDIEAAKSNGIVVTNTPDVLSECTADLAMTLMLMATRRAGEGEREVRAGKWSGWRPTHLVGQKLTGKTLGIVGFGRIGRETAKRAHFGFGMRIIAQNRSPIDAALLAECSATQAESVEDLLAQSDIVSLHCPGGGANHHLINAERLSLMKPTAYLINTARGEVIDEDALAEALSNGQIAGAGLDVFEEEPVVRQGLLACQNAVLLPHLGSATKETREAMGFRVIDNLVAFFEGKTPPDQVN